VDVWWDAAIDGVVSCLHTYSVEDLRGLVQQLRGHERFDWQIGRERRPWRVMPITYLIGVPRREDR